MLAQDTFSQAVIRFWFQGKNEIDSDSKPKNEIDSDSKPLLDSNQINKLILIPVCFISLVSHSTSQQVTQENGNGHTQRVFLVFTVT